MKAVQVALYARVSSDKQAQEGTIESQIASVKDYIEEQGGHIDPDYIFSDNGVSGASLTRPALEALRDKAFTGELTHIYVLSPDRLARKYAHQLLLVEEFKKLNVEIVFVNRSISNTPEDQMLLQIQGVISEYEREKIIERSRRGKLHAAKKGKAAVLSGAPYGYEYVKATDTSDAHYLINPKEAEVVREVFHLYCHKMWSIGQITREFSRKGYVTRTGKQKWERSVIWGMLRNPAYSGNAAFRKTKMVPRNKPTKLARDNAHNPKRTYSSSRQRPKEEWITIPVPRIVEPSLFEKAAERLRENIRLSPRNNKKNEYLLSGLLRCAECGYAFYGGTSNSKYKRAYYRCCGQDGWRWADGRVCGGHPVRVEALDELVWNATAKLIETPEVVIAEYVRRNERLKKKGRAPSLLLKKQRELAAAEAEKERILDLYQSAILSKDEVEPRMKSVRAKLHKIQSEIALIEDEQEEEKRLLHLVKSFEEFSSTLTANLSTLSFEDKRKVVRLLVTDVVVDSTKEEIVVKHILPLKKSPKLDYSLCLRGHQPNPHERIPSHSPRLLVL